MLLLGFGFLPVILIIVVGAGGYLTATSIPDIAGVGLGAGLMMGLFFFAYLISVAASAAQVFVVGSERRVTFSEAFRWGISRLLPVIGLAILVVLVMLPFLVFFLVLSGGTFFILGALGQESAEMTAGILGGVALFVFMIVYAFLAIRLMFAYLLVALKESTVFGSFKESWRLTSGRFWPLFGRVIVAMLVFMLASMIVGFVPIVGPLFQMVIGAYLLAYFVLLFRATQHVAGAAPMMPAAPITHGAN